MRRISIFLGIFLSASVLAGCGGMPVASTSGPSLARADFGRYPPDYKALVRTWSESNLKGAGELQFGHVSRPRREWAPDGPGMVYGWSVCAMISAPNTYGEYTGPQTFWFLIHGDHVVSIRQNDTISPGHRVDCSDGQAPATS